MAFELETHFGDSKLSSVGAPTSVPNALACKQDSASGSFEGYLWRRNDVGGTGAGEDGGGAYTDRGSRLKVA
jgi:hypothetical protein